MAILINGVQVAGVGLPGKDGVDGKDATINGVNALNVTATGGIKGQQSGDTYMLDGSGLMEKVSGLQGQFLGFTDENVVGAVDAPTGGGDAGKRVCRFVVGTSMAGWTESDCDYLCDGVDDQVEINAAIQALPETGGEIVILDGTYNITAPIALDKANSTLRGNGAATVLKRMWDSSTAEGIVNVLGVGCVITQLQFDGTKTKYASTNNRGIYCKNIQITIINNECYNNSCGIFADSSSVISNNRCNNNTSYGIFSSNNNLIVDNMCHNNDGYGIYSSTSNVVVGNNCTNNNIYGIYTGSGCIVSGNNFYGNKSGLYTTGQNVVVTGNDFSRGNRQSSDYTSSQQTIRLGATTKNCLVTGNNCMGKAPVDEGTGNTLVNNKYE